MAANVTRRVLVDLLISIAVSIAVIVMTTSTTILSVVVVAAATMWRIGWKRIVMMLATWMF
jgi:hypothetical protein